MEIRKKFVLIISILFIIFSFSLSSYAGWTGPTTIVAGTWGTGTTQFGLEKGDSLDSYPRIIKLNDVGSIGVLDQVNNRVQIFNSSGSLIQVFQTNPYTFAFDSANNLYTAYKGILEKFSSTTLQWQQTCMVGNGIIDILLVGNDIITVGSRKRIYCIYTPTGTLLTTSSSRPMELGIVTGKCLTGKFLSECKNIKYSIEYPDVIYVYQEGTRYADFSGQVRIGTDTIMDNQSGYVYAFSVTQTTTISGSKPIKWLGWIATWTKPSDVYGAPVNDGVETIAPVVAQYGSPIIGPDGSIYCWKRTQTNYLILKWTWSP